MRHLPVISEHSVWLKLAQEVEEEALNASTDFVVPARPAQQPFQFTDIPGSNGIHTAPNGESSALDMDLIFQEYGFIDPELGTAWDEDHGLKPKRARTASVKQIKTFIYCRSL